MKGCACSGRNRSSINSGAEKYSQGTWLLASGNNSSSLSLAEYIPAWNLGLGGCSDEGDLHKGRIGFKGFLGAGRRKTPFVPSCRTIA